jgi:putative FmdB family regulatory protein
LRCAFSDAARGVTAIMPIYEYACSACGHELEALQKLSDPKLVTCPACHRDTLAKKVSAAGFQLKGSGWYVTDFRNGSKAASKAGDAAKDNGGAETTGESSPDKPSATKDAPAKESAGKDTTATPAPAAKAESVPAKPASAPSTGSST